jgi:hypothetical protein
MAEFAGGMSLYFSNPILKNVTIAKNMASNYGGGMFLDSSNPILTHVIIVDNTANHSGGGINSLYSAPIITNSIIWNNNPQSIDVYLGDELPLITYSDIESGFEGEGNINSNPLFTDSGNGDYTLQEDSPCIDAGIADMDGDGVDDFTDYFGDAPDMGAFEFMDVSILGDLNNDSVLNISDIILLVNIIINNGPYNAQADLNSDGINNIFDITTLVYIIIDL